MEGLPGPLKQLKLDLAEPRQPSAIPLLSHVPPVQEISEKHKWVVAALESGFKAAEVAKMFGLSPEYVKQIALWDDVELERVRREARDRMSANVVDLSARIKYHATEALERTVQIMRGDDISNARQAAKDIMDRAGYAPVKKVAEVSVEVPSHEFVQAVERMSAVSEVQDRRAEWAFQDPRKRVADIPASANIAQVGRGESP